MTASVQEKKSQHTRGLNQYERFLIRRGQNNVHIFGVIYVAFNKATIEQTDKHHGQAI